MSDIIKEIALELRSIYATRRDKEDFYSNVSDKIRGSYSDIHTSKRRVIYEGNRWSNLPSRVKGKIIRNYLKSNNIHVNNIKEYRLTSIKYNPKTREIEHLNIIKK